MVKILMKYISSSWYFYRKLCMSTFPQKQFSICVLPICAFLWWTWCTIINVALPKNYGITEQQIRKIRILLLLILANKQGSLSSVLYPIFVIFKRCFGIFTFYTPNVFLKSVLESTFFESINIKYASMLGKFLTF